MNLYSIVTEKDLINLHKLADQQKNRRAVKIENRILKQTPDIKLEEILSPITKKLDINIEATKNLGETVKKSDVKEGNTQTPFIQNIILFNHHVIPYRWWKEAVFWNDVFIQPLGENRISIKNQEFDITPDIQANFTNTKLITKFLDNIDNETVFDIFEIVGFYDSLPKIGLKSARMKDVLYNLPKAVAKNRNLPLPSIEKVEDSIDLQGDGLKVIIPSNIVDIYTRLENFLRLN